MKRKVFAMTALMMAMVLALGACGGKKNSLLDDEDLKELKNEITQIEKEEAGQSAQVQTTAATPQEITFECLPEVREMQLEDNMVQICDFLLDFSGQKTVQEVIDVIESSDLKFEYEYDPTFWLSPKTWETIRFTAEQNPSLRFSVNCINITDEMQDLKDARVVSFWSAPDCLWLPGGIPGNGKGLNYENVPLLFQGYEVTNVEGGLPANNSYNNKSGLYFSSKSVEYSFVHVVPSGIEDNTYSQYHVYFKIDPSTKEVSKLSWYYRIYWGDLGDEIDGYFRGFASWD